MVTSVILMTVVAMVAIGCSWDVQSTGVSTDQQRTSSINTRAEAFARAEALFPIPYTSNFPMRKALVKYTARQDTPNHPCYVYVLSDMGSIIGYYVSESFPVNINAFLSSTEEAKTYISGTSGITSNVLTAPSLDGIYYGGAGASQGGGGWFFFDSATDALVVLYGVKLFVSDQPLNLDVKPITIKAE